MKKSLKVFLCIMGGTVLAFLIFLLITHKANYKNVTRDSTVSADEEAEETVQSAKSWSVDSDNETVSFSLDNYLGWRLVVADAAAGTRFYVMEKTIDGGSVWECINDDPFGGDAGSAEGLIFYDENFGIAGLAGASQSDSELYITRDGGISFEKIELPMNTVTELPESAKNYGFSVEDYDYLNMPEKDDMSLTVMVTTDAVEHEGILFRSLDNGISWEYQRVTP